jgi:two-component system cell cycle sensor histidine kinase/response regulator CckA
MDARDELRARNAELEAIFRALPDLLFELTPRAVLVAYRAGRSESLYRRDPRDFLGKPVDEVLPAEPARQISAAVARVVGGEPLVCVEYELPMAEGARRFEARLVPGEGGNVIAWARDITDQRRAEEERRQLDRKVEEAQRLESLGVLAGGIAHDFNNLLAAIIGGAELLARHAPEGSPIHAPLEIVRQSAWRASELSRQLLAYAGKGQLELQHVDLGALVRDTAQLLESAIYKRARLELDIAPGLPAVYGDVAQLRQVVMNLITNASDSLAGRDGRITLHLRGERIVAGSPDETELAPGDYVALEIVDDGCGMEEATRLRMFDPFFSTKGMGRGLGLASVLGIVRAHRGRITVESDPGAGTRIGVVIPASEQPAESIERERPVSVGPIEGGAVLVVDDEPGVREVIARILEEAGLSVVTAPDGRSALDVFERHGAIHLAIVDMTMPHLGGAETFAALRGLDPAVAVILISGHDESDARRDLEGAEHPPTFLQKPFRTGALLAAVRSALSARPPLAGAS